MGPSKKKFTKNRQQINEKLVKSFGDAKILKNSVFEIGPRWR